MAILKLDDLIKEENTIELQGKTFHYNLSFKSMLKFKKWSETNDLSKDIDDENVLAELIQIMILEADAFIKILETLSLNNQTRILNSITSGWVKEMIPNFENQGDNSKK